MNESHRMNLKGKTTDYVFASVSLQIVNCVKWKNLVILFRIEMICFYFGQLKNNSPHKSMRLIECEMEMKLIYYIVIKSRFLH